MSGRREWNERYGSYIKREHVWKVVAVFALAIALIAVGGVVYIGAQNRIVPYIVEVDKLGNAVAVRRADLIQPTDPRVMRAMLARFIVNVRSVLVDATAQKRAILEAYAMLRQPDPATGLLNEFFQSAQSPFKRAQTETVTVEIENVLPISANYWQVEWREVVRNRKGIEIKRHRHKANMTIVVVPPTDDATIIKNPIGLYIEELSWSKLL